MLTLYLGPMKAGKSETLIRLYNKYKSIDKKIYVINHIYDTERTNKIDTIRTHSNIFIDAHSTNSLLKMTLDTEYINSDIIIIDESQFFIDLVIFIEDQIKEYPNKKFYVFGLIADINQKKIGNILDLIPIADDIIHLKAYCNICKDGTPAPFTKMKQENQVELVNQIRIGDDIYFPVCRRHLK
jgi:thymidine kinase